MKNYTTNSIRVIVYSMIFLFLLGSSNLFAQNDKNYFYAKYDDQVGIVYFHWYLNYQPDKNSKFIIWHADGPFKEFIESDFTKIVDIFFGEAADNGNGQYYYKIPQNLDLTIQHSFCLQTVTPDGTSKLSNVFILDNIVIEPPPGIEFTEFPSQYAYKNKKYISSIKAVYRDDETKVIKYELKEAPKGMTLNSSTGEISWTPFNNDYAHALVRASLADNPKIYSDSYFEIYVRTCEEPIVVTGNLTNKYNESIQNGYVMLMPVDANQNEKPREFMYSEVVEGQFKLEADAGNFFLFFYDNSGRTFIYDNADNIENAKVIKLECGNNITLNWNIKNYSDRLFTISGKVLDKDGNPIPNWNVFFQTISDKNIDGFYQYTTVTDEAGLYKIELPEEFSYYAFTYLDLNDFNKYHFNTLYFNQTFDISKAEKLSLTKNLENIDFQFIDNPDFTYFVVSGQVLDENKKPLPGISVAFEGFTDNIDKNQYYKYYDQVNTDDNGIYQIKLPNLFKYIAYAVNINSKNDYKDDYYMPLYYNQTYSREKATIIKLDNDISGIDFIFKSQNITLSSSISGTVYDENDQPIPFAFIEALYHTDDGINSDRKFAYAFSDEKGNFTIKNLKQGKYILFASSHRTEEFMCGYYVKGSLATINFEEATQIDLPDMAKLTGIEIKLPKFIEKNGGGIIKGKIYNKSNYSENNKDNSAINSAKIYVKENKNALASFQESNADGSFVISGLVDGEYNFVIDKAGFQKFEQLLNVSEENATDLGLIMLIPLAGNGITDNNLLYSEVYPNPANNEVTLNFISQSNEVIISIYGVNGSLVKLINTDALIGDNKISLNVNDLQSGNYIAVINDGKTKSAVSLILQK